MGLRPQAADGLARRGASFRLNSVAKDVHFAYKLHYNDRPSPASNKSPAVEMEEL
jgi:hypothetical protein